MQRVSRARRDRTLKVATAIAAFALFKGMALGGCGREFSGVSVGSGGEAGASSGGGTAGSGNVAGQGGEAGMAGQGGEAGIAGHGGIGGQGGSGGVAGSGGQAGMAGSGGAAVCLGVTSESIFSEALSTGVPRTVGGYVFTNKGESGAGILMDIECGSESAMVRQDVYCAEGGPETVEDITQDGKRIRMTNHSSNPGGANMTIHVEDL